MEKVKILFLAANPSRDLQLDKLRLDEEFREINAKIRASEYRDTLELTPCLALRPDDLRPALMQLQPHILHFSGHGTPSDGLVLLDNSSQPYPVSQNALADLLRTIKGSLRLVVLNACYTRPLAEELADVIGCAIGVSKALGDEAAISFAAAFYEALGYAKSVQTAFELGLNSLSMKGAGEERTPEEPHRKLILPGRGKANSDTDDQIPQLITRDGVDASAVFFVKPKPTFEEITRHARKRIAEEASRWLAQECDPFVMPALKRRVTYSESTTMRHEADPWEPLSDDETKALILGQLAEDQNRIRIFSQSGTGKTTLLHYCEQQIAAAGDGRVPIRVTRLSELDWRGDVIGTIANDIMHSFLPADTDNLERIAWLSQLVREHRVVFLLDAVDQTNDELLGLSLFLESADVCRCPAILTGRPEVEQTRASVFQGNWDTCRVEPFDEPQIRQYLGELSDKLLPVKNERWENKASYERKQQWSDLLHVPLLLSLMRRLATDDAEGSTQGSLTDLHNRHAVYREAIRHLIDQGWTSLAQTPNREDLLDHAEVNEYLSEMAWGMIVDDNFTSVFHGKPFQRWRSRNRQAVRALEQVDLTTRYSLLDNPGELGLAWRHLSFCEYFAGVHLAEQNREVQETVVREHGCKPSWQWVFRFALSELAADDRREECTELARDLIRFGNPFLVYDAIRGDGLTLSEQLDKLCRWLVHREWSSQGGDYREACKSVQQRPVVDPDMLSVLETLFDRLFRDSRCLHPAWELLTSSSDPLATEIQARFLAEFAEVAGCSETGQAVARSGDRPQQRVSKSLSLDEHLIQCPPVGQEDQAFHIGEDAERAVEIKPFYLGKAPITNLQFELFDPSHKQWRDQYSPDDDSPALYVNWYMAVMFCTWLGEEHRLPTEEEWEVACRAGATTKYWWGDEFDGEKCNSSESKSRRATPANPAHANHWGFMEMSGNVWEWCQNEYSPGSDRRVLRGGSFLNEADYCRSAYRSGFDPAYRFSFIGFRVSRTYT